MIERRRVTRADIQAKLRQIDQSIKALVQQLLQQLQHLAKLAAAPLVLVLASFAYLKGRRKKRRTIIEVRRAP